jgi:metal-responsive CopG/Arc/MetJ family transcriptional regulator
MRTTVTLAEDVVAAVERVRRERLVGVSEAVNELVREELISDRHDEPFVQKTYPMGSRST